MNEQCFHKIRAIVDSFAGAAMPVVAPAKVNLRLKVLGRRDDGYHLLSMLNCATSLCDELGISFLSDSQIELSIEPHGTLQGEPLETNLVVRAFREFWSEFGFKQPPVGLRCGLTKSIPIGGGLGGGSSDAGAVLRVLTVVFGPVLRAELELSPSDFSDRVAAAALRCGADVPYAYLGGLCWVSGIGEQVVQLTGRRVSPERVVILVPRTSVNTRAFYESFRRLHPLVPRGEDTRLKSFVDSGEGELTGLVENDFEATVCGLNPEVAEGLALARSVFPHTTALTGSGSALFSLVPKGRETDMSNLSTLAQERGYAVYPTCLIFD